MNTLIIMYKICFISLSAYGYFNENAPAGGGAQRQFYFLSTELTDSFDVHFVVGDYGQSKVEYREEVTLHRAYAPDRSASTTQRAKQLVYLWNALRRADADVYVTRCPPQKLNKLFFLIKLLDRPLVYHIATDEFVGPLSKRSSKLCYEIYNRALQECEVVVQTQRQADKLQQYWHTDATIIPNGYPEASIIDTYESRKHFLWVGRLDETEKRPHLFLDLADELPDEKFIMIGAPEKDNQYSVQVIQRASNMSNVTYPGTVPPSNIHKYYQSAIAVINTSVEDKEGFPNTFLESWRYGTPVLSLEIDTSTFIKNNRCITGYARGEFENLVKVAEYIAGSIEDLKAIGIDSHDSYRQKYKLGPVVNSYQQVLEEAVSKY